MPRGPFNFGLPTVILTNIAGTLIDAVLQEDTTTTYRLSDIPLESGAIATDHKAKLPKKYNLTGRISDTPFLLNRVVSEAFYNGLGIGIVEQTVRSIVGGLVTGDSIAGFLELERIADADAFFTIVYGMGRLDNMQFLELSAPRTAKDGRSIKFDAKLQRMLVQNTSEVLAEDIDTTVNHTAVEPQNLGLQPTAPL